jgi:hypothetical protein
LFGVAFSVEELRLNGGVIENKLVLGRICCILGRFRVEIVFSEWDPLCLPVVLWVLGYVEVSRTSVRIFAVASSFRCRLRSRSSVRGGNWCKRRFSEEYVSVRPMLQIQDTYDW